MRSSHPSEVPNAEVIEFLYAMSGRRYWEDSFLDGVTVEIWGPGTPGIADHWHVFVREDRDYPGLRRFEGPDWQRLHAWHARQLEAKCETLRAAAEAAAEHLAYLSQGT